MIHQKELILRLVKKRFLVSIINFFLFFFILNLILEMIEFLIYNSTNMPSNLVFFFLFTLWYILYFGYFVRTTHGYTLGGLILRVKITKVDDSEFCILHCLKRPYHSFFSYLRLYTSFSPLEVNSLGQMPYDKKYHTTMIALPNHISNTDEVITYKLTYYDFITEIAKVWGFFFLFMILIVLVQYLFDLAT